MRGSTDIVKKCLFGVIALVLLAGVFLGGYGLGRRVSTTSSSNMAATAQSLQVPTNATIISQCTEGLGTQYVVPKNIPQGPIYNVYQGKVIGLEFMVPQNTSAMTSSAMTTMSSSDATTLQLYGMKYDHINITLMPQGHAGLSAPHYMADVMTVPSSTTHAITCGMTSPSPSTSMSTSM